MLKVIGLVIFALDAIAVAWIAFRLIRWRRAVKRDRLERLASRWPKIVAERRKIEAEEAEAARRWNEKAPLN